MWPFSQSTVNQEEEEEDITLAQKQQ